VNGRKKRGRSFQQYVNMHMKLQGHGITTYVQPQEIYAEEMPFS